LSRFLLSHIGALLVLASFADSQSSTLAQNQAGAGPATAPPITFHVSTRIVTVEVVARDHHGNPVTNLTANDFEVFDEAAGSHKEKKEEKIAAFRALGTSDFAAKNNGPLQVPTGVYTKSGH